jgi:lysine 2,3-aminomutase
VTTLRDLERHLDLDDGERAALQGVPGDWPLVWTPHVLRVLSRADPAHPLRRQLVHARRTPVDDEVAVAPGPADAQLAVARARDGALRCHGERAVLRVDGILADRARPSAPSLERTAPPAPLEPALEALRGHPEVRELTLGGDDPLLLDDDRLELLLRELRTLRHLETVRLLTRLPVLLPRRFTARLLQVLRRARPLFVVARINHALELDDRAAQAVRRCLDAGVPLLGHTALLRGVNDDEESLRALLGALRRLGISPGRLVLPARGASLAVPPERAVALVEGLRARLGELSVPWLVLEDPPGGSA